VRSSGTVRFVNATLTYSSGLPWARRLKTALDDISLSLEPGVTTGLIGESGSGKSSLARLALGLLQPTSGMVQFEDQGEVQTGRAPGRFALVSQNPDRTLNPMLRIGLSIAEPLTIRGGLPGPKKRAAVLEMMSRVGLNPDHIDRLPAEFSGGQRQRIAIARALITRPQFIVFDEAVSALDVSVQAQVLNLIKDLQATMGFASLFISHDLAATRYAADRIVVLYQGRIVEDAPASIFYGSPAHPYSRALRIPVVPADSPAFALRNADGAQPSAGCRLAPRCPWAIERCGTDVPLIRPVGLSHAACHRAEEVVQFNATHIRGGTLAAHTAGEGDAL
jgi:ABC-type glutathione transport system ATPase component